MKFARINNEVYVRVSDVIEFVEELAQKTSSTSSREARGFPFIAESVVKRFRDDIVDRLKKIGGQG